MGNDPAQSGRHNPDENRESSDLHPQEINLSKEAKLPPPAGVERGPEESVLADLVCRRTVLSRAEEAAVAEFREAVGAALGVSADDDLGESAVRLRHTEPQRSELTEIIDKIDATSRNGQQAIVPDFASILADCKSTDRPCPALREPELFNINDSSQASDLFVFGRYDSGADRWRVGFGLSPRLIEQAVENFIKSVDDDHQKDGTGSFSCVRFLVNDLLELKLRGICRSAGLRGEEHSDTVRSLLSEGLGAVVRSDYEVEWSDDLRSASFKVIALMPTPPPAPLAANNPHLMEFSVRVELNRCQELSVSIDGGMDLGLASLF